MIREDNIQEWSRDLMAKHGVQFRMYSGDKETLERWADHLSFIYKKRFVVREDTRTTLHDWSRMIGG
jgi:hypothetical protein